MGRSNKVESVWDESDDEEHVSNARGGGGDLHEYARKGNHKAVATLIRKSGRGNMKLNLNPLDSRNCTPLMLACQHGWFKVVDYLGQAGAQTDLKDKDGYAAIHHCVLAAVNAKVGLGRAATCVRALHKNGAEMDRKTVDGRTVLHLALQMGIPELCTALRETGCDFNKFSTEGYNAIYYGCVGVHKDRAIENVKGLLRLGAKLGEKEPTTGRNALHIACMHELPDICRFLIQNGADALDADNEGATAMHVAATKGSSLCISAICQALQVLIINKMPMGGPRTKDDKGPKKHVKTTYEQRKAARDARERAALSPYINPQDDNGNTPLHIACEFGFASIVDTLIGMGADTSVRNHEGKTPYHLCAEIGHTKILEKMIYREVDMNEPTDDGHTCLHFCAINNDAEMARLLLQNYPEANPQTRTGWTPLHYAATYDSVHTIVALLDYRADPMITNDENKSALDLATRPKTRVAINGGLKEQLEKEAMDRDERQKKLLDEREKKREQLRIDSTRRAQERKAKAGMPSPRSDTDEVDPLAKKAKVAKPQEAYTGRDPNVPLPGSKASSGKASSASHKADWVERASPRSMIRNEEQAKLIAERKAQREEEERLEAAIAGKPAVGLGKVVDDESGKPQRWVMLLDRLYWEVDRRLNLSHRLGYDKRHSAPQVNPWSFGLCECFGGPDCAEVVFCAFVCPCVLYGQNASQMNSKDHPCLGGNERASCVADCMFRLATYPLCHACMHARLRASIRRKYGIAQADVGDMCATCVCAPCALVQEAQELRAQGAQIRHMPHEAVNQML